MWWKISLLTHHFTPGPLPTSLLCQVRIHAGVLLTPAVAPPVAAHFPAQSAAQWPRTLPPPSPPHSSSDVSPASGSHPSIFPLPAHRCFSRLAHLSRLPRLGARPRTSPAFSPAHPVSPSAGWPVWPNPPYDTPTGQATPSQGSVPRGGNFRHFPGGVFALLQPRRSGPRLVSLWGLWVHPWKWGTCGVARGGGESGRWGDEALQEAGGSVDATHARGPWGEVLPKGAVQSGRDLCDAGSAGHRRHTDPKCLKKQQDSREVPGDVLCLAIFLSECISQCGLLKQQEHQSDPDQLHENDWLQTGFQLVSKHFTAKGPQKNQPRKCEMNMGEEFLSPREEHYVSTVK